MLPSTSDQTNLSADVPPFVPRRETFNDQGFTDQPTLPRYVTTCYPFVQEQQDGRLALPQDGNGQYVPVSFAGPLEMPPRPFVVEMLPQRSAFVGGESGSGGGEPVSMVYGERYAHPEASHVATHIMQKHKHSGQVSRKITRRNVATQKEADQSITNAENQPAMVDSCQQTDFPLSIASKSLTDRPSPLKKSSRSRKQVAIKEEDLYSSSDHADADVDSDSGYYSPKHRVHKRSGGTSTTELTSGHSSTSRHQNNENPSPVPQVVYLAPSPALYQVQQPVGPPVMHSMLSPHPPPPPEDPLLSTPPPPPIMGQTSVLRGPRPPPGFPPPPSFFKPQMQFPQAMVWNPRPQFSVQNPRLLAPNQFMYSNQGGHQFIRHFTLSQKYKRQTNQYDNQQFSPAHFSADGRFDKRKQDKRKGRATHGVSPLLRNGIQQEHTIFLTDSQEFPGLGGPSDQSQSLLGNPTFSYSDAVLGKTKTLRASNMQLADTQSMHEKVAAQKNRKRQKKAERASKAADEEYAEISKEQEDIKKALKKTAANRNRSKTPMLDLSEIVSKLESTPNKESPSVAESSTNIETQSQPPLPNTRSKSAVSVPVNPLDSTSPMVKRGKEREIPRQKKPSALKKVILKEREEKKEHRLNQLTTCDLPDTDIPPYPPAILDTLKSKTVEEEVDTSSLIENIPPSVPQIHSRRYREYCSQVLDKTIDEVCTTILQKLVQFQDRLYVKDPMKAKMKRRLVMGIREVTKHLKLKKLKCVIISPNLEKIKSKGGLDEALQQILTMCEEQDVIYVFALGRRAMGRAVSKLVPVSIIGIFDYSGAEEHYKKMCQLVIEAQKKYQEMVSIYQQEVIDANSNSNTQGASSPSGPPKRFPHMTHSRNPSAASCVSFASFISEPISEMNEASNWRAMMEAGEVQYPLSPPPEDVSSSEEEEEEEPSKASVNPMLSHEELSRKDSGSTVVEVKEQTFRDIRQEPLAEEEDGELSIHDLSSNSSSKNREEENQRQGALEKSFSNSSTVVNPLVSARSDATNKSSEKTSYPLNDPSSDSSSLFETIDEETSQDRIQMWLETSSQSVQNLTLDSSSDREDQADSGSVSSKENSEPAQLKEGAAN